jgi:hypothetical protein
VVQGQSRPLPTTSLRPTTNAYYAGSDADEDNRDEGEDDRDEGEDDRDEGEDDGEDGDQLLAKFPELRTLVAQIVKDVMATLTMRHRKESVKRPSTMRRWTITEQQFELAKKHDLLWKVRNET